MLCACGSQGNQGESLQTTAEVETSAPAEVTEQTRQNEAEAPTEPELSLELFRYTVTLWRQEGGAEGDYLIRLTDAETNEVLQELPSHLDTKPLELREGSEVWSQNDIVIICEENGEEWTSFLYEWDWKELKLKEAPPVKIPSDYRPCERYYATFSTIKQQENEEEKITEEIIYRTNVWSDRGTYALRKWTLVEPKDEEKGSLVIWDCLQDKTLFDGEITLKDGKPINNKYFQWLFLEELNDIREEDEEAKEINVFADAEYTDDEDADWDMRFTDEEEFLKRWGFDNEEPFYQYTDATGELQLVLYYNESAQKGAGIVYDTHYSPQKKKWVEKRGFVFKATETATWKKPNPYELTVYDEDNKGEDTVLDYKEEFTYTDDGKLDSFSSGGIWEEYEEETGVLRFDYTYRDNGTLCYREYGHNPYFFATTFQWKRSYYDEQERLIHEHCYITHGYYDFYYIYLDEDDKPEYCLKIDDYISSVWPEMVAYE